MSYRHFRRLGLLIEDPEVKKFKTLLERIYGFDIIHRFWYCLPYSRPVWGRGAWEECVTRSLADLKRTLPVLQRRRVDKFFEDMPKIQEMVRDFLTQLMRARRIEEMEMEKMEEELKEEATKLKEKLREVL